MGRRWAWVSLAIVSMWMAVLFISLFAPSLESISAGGNRTTVPVAGIVAAGVAFIATIVVAVIGFRDGQSESAAELHEIERKLAELERRMPDQNTAPHGRGRISLSR